MIIRFLYGEDRMKEILIFLLNSVALGVGLAMDAFSVSMANGLNEPGMPKKRMALIAGTFAFFQWFMPMAGWLAIHTVLSYFKAFQKFIPWIALILLCWLGGKMLFDGFTSKESEEAEEETKVSHGALFVQGIATSIDALSVGFTIAAYNLLQAFSASVIIAIVTFFICIAGLLIGRKFGMKLSNKASILGGIILIAIGLEIFITGIF